MPSLSSRDLLELVRSAFPALPGDHALAVMVDVPRDPGSDNPEWQARRRLAAEWARGLRDVAAQIPLERVDLVAYGDVGSNNADLPASCAIVTGDLPPSASGLGAAGRTTSFEDMIAGHQILLAPTEYSATAPLKLAARGGGFRAATMAGFSAAMIPALRLDYAEVARRVDLMKGKLDRADRADFEFVVDGARTFRLALDLRFRTGHASSGRFPARGMAGNLPSGEAYIVPYEGERGEPSASEGLLPVQLGAEVVVYEIRANRAVSVDGDGAAAVLERDHLGREPAYGNIAELGCGVLGDFGIEPVGETLLDEKLGLHIAFGRSDHFGGMVGPGNFSSPGAVVHIDRVYVPAVQPRVQVRSVDFTAADGSRERVFEGGRYRCF